VIWWGEGVMPRAGWTLTDDDWVSSAAAMNDTSPPWTTSVVVIVDGDSNWKALALGVFVVAGVVGKSPASS